MTADLFGLEQSAPRTNSRPEAAALVEVLKALRAHHAECVTCQRAGHGYGTRCAAGLVLWQTYQSAAMRGSA